MTAIRQPPCERHATPVSDNNHLISFNKFLERGLPIGTLERRNCRAPADFAGPFTID
jgi:hypothetical protein